MYLISFALRFDLKQSWSLRFYCIYYDHHHHHHRCCHIYCYCSIITRILFDYSHSTHFVSQLLECSMQSNGCPRVIRSFRIGMKPIICPTVYSHPTFASARARAQSPPSVGSLTLDKMSDKLVAFNLLHQLRQYRRGHRVDVCVQKFCIFHVLIIILFLLVHSRQRRVPRRAGWQMSSHRGIHRRGYHIRRGQPALP